jgi:Pyruvate/2-oxoacid:ferredoxin oxidoreductase gamma subunit
MDVDSAQGFALTRPLLRGCSFVWRKVVNILIASVGGQGGLTLARVLAEAAVMSGWSVRTGETLGMAQRYGSVVSYVRLGLGVEVRSPTFTPGEADYLLGLELFESLRNIHYLSENGVFKKHPLPLRERNSDHSRRVQTTSPSEHHTYNTY